MIQIQNVTRRYGHLVAVEDVSLSIGRGEVVGLLGHNGAGKTTLMRMLCGSLDPTTGSLSVAGHDLQEARIEAQKHIGYLPERAPLYLDMPVWDHLIMLAQLRGLAPADHERAAMDAARDAGLLERLAQPVRELSKGFRQRVGIAGAILHRPPLLVLDEPTNGLDPDQIHAIRLLIRRLAEHSTILLSTHILQEVEAVCDRVVMLIGGRLVEDSPLQDLLHTRRVCAHLQGVQLEQLERHPHLDDVAEEQPGHFSFVTELSNDTIGKALLELAAAAGGSVLAFHPEVVRLESVFEHRMAEHRLSS